MARWANGFDLIRLVLAVLVVYTHSFLLCGYGAEPTFELVKQQETLGGFAVLGFFGISGYLVTASWDRSAGPGSFLWNRVLRIFPGFWVCLLVVAAVIGPLLAVGRSGTAAGYPVAGPDGAARFVLANALLKVNQWTIGTTLDGAPYPESLDGSLWSIFPEFTCYLLTAGLGLLSAARQNRVLLVGLIAYLGCLHAITILQPGPWTASRGPTLLMLGKGPMYVLAYLVGAGLWVFRGVFEPNGRGAIATGVLFAVTLKFGGAVLLAPFVLPVFLIYLALSINAPLRWDLSYGVYLYHFPLFQVLALNEWLRDRPALFLLAGLGATLAAAAMSWVLVEAPALRLKRRKPRPVAGPVASAVTVPSDL
jgi:peptidoglycan/LPS O-acetylase OafA/YrhL